MLVHLFHLIFWLNLILNLNKFHRWLCIHHAPLIFLFCSWFLLSWLSWSCTNTTIGFSYRCSLAWSRPLQVLCWHPSFSILLVANSFKESWITWAIIGKKVMGLDASRLILNLFILFILFLFIAFNISVNWRMVWYSICSWISRFIPHLHIV